MQFHANIKDFARGSFWLSEELLLFFSGKTLSFPTSRDRSTFFLKNMEVKASEVCRKSYEDDLSSLNSKQLIRLRTWNLRIWNKEEDFKPSSHRTMWWMSPKMFRKFENKH